MRQLLLPLLVASALAQNPAMPLPPASSTPQPVSVCLTVNDQGGNPISGLGKDEFTVLDNRRGAPVVDLRPAGDTPLRLGILLLASRTNFAVQQKAALQLLRTLRPGIDQAFIVTQAAGGAQRSWPSTYVAWSADPQALAAFVRTLAGNISLPGAFDVASKMMRMDPEQVFRRVLVQFRDPSFEAMVEWNPMPYRELEAAKVREIVEMQRARTTVFTLAIDTIPMGTETGRMTREREIAYDVGRQKIERIAVTTGGRVFFPAASDYSKEVETIEKQLQAQYWLSFVPNPDLPGRSSHALEVRVNRKDARVSSAKEFYTGTP